MFPAKYLLDCMSEIFCAIQTINTFSLTHLIHTEQTPGTGIGRKNHSILIDHDQAFLHIFCNQRKFCLLLFCQLQLILDFPILSVYLT